MGVLPETAPAPGTVLCRLDEIEEPGSRGFVFGEGEAAFAMFVVRSDGRLFGYVNRCPHANLPLNRRHRFLSGNKASILCMVHGAKYRIEDGGCAGGPCHGLTLTPVAVESDGQVVRIATAPAAQSDASQAL